MTYNEFMGAFEEYRICRIKQELSKFESQKEACITLGIDKSMLSKIVNGRIKPSQKITKKIVGNIYDEDIKPVKELEIEFYENKLAEVRGNK
jgi:transcriptional regulator with XRE-family HTH domain